jgi:hypothetical protein
MPAISVPTNFTAKVGEPFTHDFVLDNSASPNAPAVPPGSISSWVYDRSSIPAGLAVQNESAAANVSGNFSANDFLARTEFQNSTRLRLSGTPTTIGTANLKIRTRGSEYKVKKIATSLPNVVLLLIEGPQGGYLAYSKPNFTPFAIPAHLATPSSAKILNFSVGGIFLSFRGSTNPYIIPLAVVRENLPLEVHGSFFYLTQADDQRFQNIALNFVLENQSATVGGTTNLLNVVQLKSGPNFQIALKNDGTLAAWGGTGVILEYTSTGYNFRGGYDPYPPTGISEIQQISEEFSRHTLALKNDGTVVAFGLNDKGQNNVPQRLQSTSHPDFVPAIKVVTGRTWSGAFLQNGELVTWGIMGNGDLTASNLFLRPSWEGPSDEILNGKLNPRYRPRDFFAGPDRGFLLVDDLQSPLANGSFRSLLLGYGNNTNSTAYSFWSNKLVSGHPTFATNFIAADLGLHAVEKIFCAENFNAVFIGGTMGEWFDTFWEENIGHPFKVSNFPQDIPITITAGTPQILADQTLEAPFGTAFNRTPALVDATNRPVTSWSATGLPAWASINATTGAITGTPQQGSRNTVTLTVTGPGGTDTKTFTLLIAFGPPIITPGQNFNAKVGDPFSATVALTDAANRPASSWNAVSLPAGLSINSFTGVISGTPLRLPGGSVLIQAVGRGGASQYQGIYIEVGPGVPIIRASQILSGEIGKPFSRTPTLTDAANRPVTSWSSDPLPAGLSLNTTTGAITGTPTDDGTFVVNLTATGPGGSVTTPITFQLVANPNIVVGPGVGGFFYGNKPAKVIFAGKQLA